MPLKPTITSIPAGFQGMWRLDPSLNRGESTPIQAITMASGFYSGGEDADDDGGDDHGDDENQSENGTPNQAPPLQSNMQGRPRKKSLNLPLQQVRIDPKPYTLTIPHYSVTRYVLLNWSFEYLAPLRIGFYILLCDIGLVCSIGGGKYDITAAQIRAANVTDYESIIEHFVDIKEQLKKSKPIAESARQASTDTRNTGGERGGRGGGGRPKAAGPSTGALAAPGGGKGLSPPPLEGANAAYIRTARVTETSWVAGEAGHPVKPPEGYGDVLC
ncbi:hypothetical protein GMDG_05877 [Pseudogymnoascus destructans 20631-21]|uniref:Uncharacterized protein n=1 Tax=Pseudogymnoascus destructans (strain ATCC MYA-4855 / 20631-21) TaxID=658429 RepID=L8FTI8_PSED2|nr:hypothetical protein GMDG_05877 [Pseudogymnoascus destructans 20631-21]